MTAPGALVVGGDYRGLGIVRSLGRHGIDVWVAQDQQTLAGRSRYARHRLHWPEGEAAQERFLLEVADAYDLDGWVLFPTSDPVAAMMGRHHEALAERYRMTVSPWAQQQYAANKRLSYERADALGIARPDTFHPTGPQELVGRELAFPVILKPATKNSSNPLCADKAWRVDDRAQLLDRYAEASAFMPYDNIMVQELLDGGGEARFSYAAVCRAGEPVAWITARRTRQYPVDFGRASTFVESIEDPGIAEPARRILADLALDGMVEVEFHHDRRDGTYKLLDINPRTWGWHSIGDPAGVDFAHVAWQVALGETPPVVAARPGVRWVRLSRDLPAAIGQIVRGRQALGPYLRTLQRPLAGPIAAADDLLPALLDVPLNLGTMASRYVHHRAM